MTNPQDQSGESATVELRTLVIDPDGESGYGSLAAALEGEEVSNAGPASVVLIVAPEDHDGEQELPEGVHVIGPGIILP